MPTYACRFCLSEYWISNHLIKETFGHWDIRKKLKILNSQSFIKYQLPSIMCVSTLERSHTSYLTLINKSYRMFLSLELSFLVFPVWRLWTHLSISCTIVNWHSNSRCLYHMAMAHGSHPCLTNEGGGADSADLGLCCKVAVRFLPSKELGKLPTIDEKFYICFTFQSKNRLW